MATEHLPAPAAELRPPRPLLTAAIVVSLKVIGALLFEAMVVVPAAAARNLARNARDYLALSIATALVAGVGGLFMSSQWQVPSGGAVVLALSVLFFLTLGAHFRTWPSWLSTNPSERNWGRRESNL